MQDDYGYTVLMRIADGDKEEMVKLLLTYPKIDVHIRNKNGYTALTWTSHNNIKKLLQAHIDMVNESSPNFPAASASESTALKSAEAADPLNQVASLQEPHCAVPAARDVPVIIPVPTGTIPTTAASATNAPFASAVTAAAESGEVNSSPSLPSEEPTGESAKLSTKSDVTAQDRAELDAFLRSFSPKRLSDCLDHTATLNNVLLKVTAHDRALQVLVNKQKECPSLFWFYPKKSELRNWLSDPMKCLFQDSLMMVVVCPVTLRVVKCGPDGLGWEISTPKAWVKKWGPAILMSIYVMQAAVIAGRIVGIPIPQLPSASSAANALGLNCDSITSGVEEMVNQEQLMACLDTFTTTTASLLGEKDASMQQFCAKMHAQRSQQRKIVRGAPVNTAEITLSADLPVQIIDESYKSIHTFLTTGENAKLGKLEDQLRGSMERVMAEDGDVEWVSVEAVEVWKQKRVVSADSHSPEPILMPEPVPVLRSGVSSSWLAVRLRQKGVREELIQECERKLVVDEDHSEEHLLAALSSEQFTEAYLNRIGIKALGLQQKLLAIHQELVIQHYPQRVPVNHHSAAIFASTDTTAALEKKLEALTKELQQLKASTSSSKSGTPVPGGGSSGDARSGGGLQQALKQRTDTATAAVNPRTGQLYTVDELVLEIQLMKSDMGVLATDVDRIKETY